MGVEEESQNLVPKNSINISILPNPSTGSAIISYKLEQRGQVRCAIFDATGREIRTLMSSPQSPGSYSLTWDRKNNTGCNVAPGVYFVRISVGQEQKQIKLVLLK